RPEPQPASKISAWSGSGRRSSSERMIRRRPRYHQWWSSTSIVACISSRSMTVMLSATGRKQRPGWHRRAGEPQRKARPRSLVLIQPQLAPHALGQLAPDGQAEAEPGLPRVPTPLKAAEDLLAVLGGD